MFPDATPPVPASLRRLRTAFAPLFTAPSFRTFRGLACGCGHKGHQVRVPAVASPAHGRGHRRGAARPTHLRGGRRRLRGRRLSRLPPGITWTTRLRKDAALYGPQRARTGRRGRPRAKGTRLPCLNSLAMHAAFAAATVTRYQKTATAQADAVTCLWYGVFGRPGRQPGAGDRAANTRRIPHHPPGRGNRSGITTKVELRRAGFGLLQVRADHQVGPGRVDHVRSVHTAACATLTPSCPAGSRTAR
jgi:hypothetical protein